MKIPEPKSLAEEIKINCIDNEGRPFVDEFCDAKVYCSKWGLFGDYKCDSNKWKNLEEEE